MQLPCILLTPHSEEDVMSLFSQMILPKQNWIGCLYLNLQYKYWSYNIEKKDREMSCCIIKKIIQFEWRVLVSPTSNWCVWELFGNVPVLYNLYCEVLYHSVRIYKYTSFVNKWCIRPLLICCFKLLIKW